MEAATKLEINTNLLREGWCVLRAINNPMRQHIIRFIQGRGSTNVSDIYKELELEQAVVSQHLRILRDGGFVHTDRKGKEIHYTLHYERFSQVDRLIKSVL